MGRGSRKGGGGGVGGMRGGVAEQAPLLDKCRSEVETAVYSAISELSKSSDKPITGLDVIAKTKGRVSENMVRRAIDSLSEGTALRPPLLHGDFINMKPVTQEEYYSEGAISPEMLRHCNDDQKEVLRILAGACQGSEEPITYEDFISMAAERMGKERAFEAFAEMIEPTNTRPALIAGAEDGFLNKHSLLSPIEKDVFAERLYGKERGQASLARRLKDVDVRNKDLRHACQSPEDRAVIEAMIRLSPFEEGAHGSTIDSEQIAASARELALMSAGEKERFDPQESIEGLVARGALIDMAEGRYRLRDVSDGLGALEQERWDRYADRYGQEDLRERLDAIGRRNLMASDMASSEAEKGLIAYMQDRNPEWEGSEYGCLETIHALSEAYPDADLKEAFESLYEKGVLQKTNESTSWAKQRYCIASHLAYI